MARDLKHLLTNEILERSGVVANCRMNRERTLTGGNGYTREIGFNPFEFLVQAASVRDNVRWLDLCCGTGNALIEAARSIEALGLSRQIQIVGVDLVGMFTPQRINGVGNGPDTMNSLQLIEASVMNWQPERQFDLITCVHGLHYIGDKLKLLIDAASWLTDNGQLAANLSLENLKLWDAKSASRTVAAELRRQGLDYDSRRKRIQRKGRATIRLPFRYLGADDSAGPNYSGQPAVDSYYELVNE